MIFGRAPTPLLSPACATAPACAAPAERRGPLRPTALASSRARAEARATERLVQALESAVVVILAATICAAIAPRGLLLAPLADVLPFAIGPPLVIACLASTRAASAQMHDPLRRSLARACAGLLLAGLLVAGLVAILPVEQNVTRAVKLWFALTGAAVFVLHLVWWARLAQLRREGKLTPTVVIVGATDCAERLIARARATGEIAVLGVFDDRGERAPSSVGGVKVLGDTAALLVHRIMPYVDRVVITVPSGAHGRIRQLLERLRLLPNEILLVLDFDGDITPFAALSCLAQAPVARLSGGRLADSGVLAKRVQDLVLGTVALVVFAPLMALTALAVALDSPGPVLFRQRRHGFNSETIVVWKFRSMRHADADAHAGRQISAGDARVTRVGRFIRRTSLDELPQLFNVLRGEMSLVGPRPHAIGMKTGDTESSRLVAGYAHRNRMKPGITSWAAIHGSRGPVDSVAAIRRRVTLDIEYIERQSLWLDLYVLLMTLPRLLGDADTVR